MPETSANTNQKATKNLAAAAPDTSAAGSKDTSTTADKATTKKTTEAAQHTTAAAASPTEFQNAGTTATTEPTSTHSTSVTHASSSVHVSSSASFSSVMPVPLSSMASQMSSATTSAAALPTATTTDSSSQSSPSVAGPVVGSIAGVAVVGAIAFFFIRKRNKQKRSRASHAFSQFLNDAPPHHGNGNVRDSMWGMPSKTSEKEGNNGYAISSPPPPPEKAYNPEFGSPPPMSPPAAYSAYDQQHHVSPPTSPHAGGYSGSSPQAQYGNSSPSHIGGHDAAIAGAAVAGAAAMAAHHQQYPNEVNGDMPLSAPSNQQSPQQHNQDLGGQDNAYYQQSPQQQHQNVGGQDEAYYHQSPSQQHQYPNGQDNAYYQQSPQQQYQQQQPAGYDQQYAGYEQGYQQGPQQYYDPNSQQYIYSHPQPYSQYNSMYIGTDQSYYQPEQAYNSQYPANAAANVFAHSGHAAENADQPSYEMMPQQPVAPPTDGHNVEQQQQRAVSPTEATANNTIAPASHEGIVLTTPQSEPVSETIASSPTVPGNAAAASAPELPTIEQNQTTSARSINDHPDQTSHASAEHNDHHPLVNQQSNPYVLDVPLEYNHNDPARETLYGLSEHYQYGGDDTTGGQELSSGHHDVQAPKPPTHGHNDDLM